MIRVDTVVVGRIGRAHGVRGEVVVEVRTDDPAGRFAAGSLLRTEPPASGPLMVASSRWHGGRLLVGFARVTDRTGAQALNDALLVADAASSAAPADPEQFWDHQLIGLAAVRADGRPLGWVAEVVHPPGGDLLAIRGADEREILVPFVAAIVPNVDLGAGRLVVDSPAGLLET